MHVSTLALHDFRSYKAMEVALEPGVSVFVGPNGQGKTNLVEAIDYLATLASHRVATDAPLVRAGAAQAVIRAVLVRAGRAATLEVEINPGGSNRARVNRAGLPRPRELLGLLRVVVFAPEDLALVKGDPSERRRFLDTLLSMRAPRLGGVRADYDRVLRQRNSLLKTAASARRYGGGAGQLETLETWDEHLARTGAELMSHRSRLVAELQAHVASAYAQISSGTPVERTVAGLSYRPSFQLPDDNLEPGDIAAALLAEVNLRRAEEIARGVTLVGPHRDELELSVGELPARGYASHGESWSFALALRLGAYDLLRASGDDPILILDDVFAELDPDRRHQLANLVQPAEQLLVTAAVADDVPQAVAGARFEVMDGVVSRAR